VVPDLRAARRRSRARPRRGRRAFDLLATRGAQQLGVQVKRARLPVRLPAADWKRMQAEASRLGWRAVVAVVTREGSDLGTNRLAGRLGRDR